MTYTRLLKNQLVMHGNDVESQEPSNVWHVVVSGRVDMCVRTQTEGKTYRMCGFKVLITFSLILLFKPHFCCRLALSQKLSSCEHVRLAADRTYHSWRISKSAIITHG